MKGNEELVFRKSSFSNGSAECVEVAIADGGRFVRDSKDKSGPMLGFSDSIWGVFLKDVKDGEFDN